MFTIDILNNLVYETCNFSLDPTVTVSIYKISLAPCKINNYPNLKSIGYHLFFLYAKRQ